MTHTPIEDLEEALTVLKATQIAGSQAQEDHLDSALACAIGLVNNKALQAILKYLIDRDRSIPHE